MSPAPTRFRRTPARWLLVASVAAFTLIPASGLAVSLDPEPGASYPPVAVGLAVAGTLAGLWLVWRTARLGIWVSSDGIVVRNLFRRHELAWSDIDGFSEPPTDGTWWGAGLGVELCDGRRVSASLYCAGALNSPGWAAPVVAALDAHLAARRDGT